MQVRAPGSSALANLNPNPNPNPNPSPSPSPSPSPAQVQRELDGLKQSSDEAIAKAARAANRVIAQVRVRVP